MACDTKNMTNDSNMISFRQNTGYLPSKDFMEIGPVQGLYDLERRIASSQRLELQDVPHNDCKLYFIRYQIFRQKLSSQNLTYSTMIFAVFTGRLQQQLSSVSLVH